MVRICAFGAGGQEPTQTPITRVVEGGRVGSLVATLVRDNETIPPRFIAMLVLQDTLVHMIGFLEGWRRQIFY
ncbi:hypothetical protein H5410_046931 [Solanum commersonii]|uniref:Uncharacterized protein n=1 Tax=Solanum commersonii TaxID=4109 RepID=A0A9J5XDK8_SOLCO|nr:hypothetical protein H5410_046931 [Solanum commersonii]